MCTTKILLFAIFANFVTIAKSSDISWVPSKSNLNIPQNAVLGGNDTNGDLIYIGRTYHEGEILPCKIVPNKRSAYISYSGKEIKKDTYEILTGTSFTWLSSAHGSLPDEALPVGITSNGETLYIGRYYFNGSLTPGKIHPAHKCLYISYNGKEYKFEGYDVLVVKE